MAERAFGTKPVVKLRGDRLADPVEPHVTEVVVEGGLTAPGSCTITFADPQRDILETIGVDFLQRIEVLASAVEETEPQPIFVGDVYGFDFMADDTGAFAVVRGYDPAYKLKQRRATASFNDMTDSDVVNKLASDAGLETGKVDGGEVVHPYLAQVNQSHWDFLQQRAQANDCVLQVRDGKLDFTKSTDATGAPAPGDHGSTDPLQLTAGHNLVYFRVRTTASQQVEGVEIRGWDPAEKQAIVAERPAETRSAKLDATPSAVGSSHGTKSRLASFPGLTSQAECDAMAASVAERVSASFGYAEGQALGDPRLQPGVAVSLGRTGRFDGRYTLSAVRHVFDRRGYHTFFTVSGDHDRTLYGLLGAPDAANRERFPGVYPALVTNVQDPLKLGRVKVTLPWLSADYETNWARVMQIGAGPDRGILWFPEVGDEVAVSFVAGDPGDPMVLGGLFNGKDRPPFEGFADAADGSIDTRCLRSRIGHTLVLKDKVGEEAVQIVTGDGKISITLDQAKGVLAVDVTGKVEVKATGDVTVKADGDLTLDASGRGTFRAAGGLALESSSDVTISGSVIRLN